MLPRAGTGHMETLVASRCLSPSGYPRVIDRWAEGVRNRRAIGSVGDGDRDGDLTTDQEGSTN